MIQTTIKYLNENDYTGNIKKAIAYFLENKNTIIENPVGKYDVCEDFFYIIQEYQTKDSVAWEAHKKYIDIQIILSGEELFEVSGIDSLTPLTAYGESKDVIEFSGPTEFSLIMKKDNLVILHPYDVHKPGLKSSPETISTVKKCLFKVLV